MLANDWTVKTMFQRADEFFQSLGMEPMTEVKGLELFLAQLGLVNSYREMFHSKLFQLFWNNSLFEQPADREVVCHATATDMFAKDDYRVKMCTKITGSDFITVNHEMGHIQYFMSYHNLSYLYREGPNPGYHEGVADILSLATGCK